MTSCVNGSPHRRVAHAEILNLYLERVAGESLWAFTDAERAFALLDDKDALDTFLHSIELERLEDVIAALENYEGRFPTKGVPSATIVLLNLMPILRKHSPRVRWVVSGGSGCSLGSGR